MSINTSIAIMYMLHYQMLNTAINRNINANLGPFRRTVSEWSNHMTYTQFHCQLQKPTIHTDTNLDALVESDHTNSASLLHKGHHFLQLFAGLRNPQSPLLDHLKLSTDAATWKTHHEQKQKGTVMEKNWKLRISDRIAEDQPHEQKWKGSFMNRMGTKS